MTPLYRIQVAYEDQTLEATVLLEVHPASKPGGRSFAITTRQAELLREQLNAWHAARKKHWPDCAMNHGGIECDMGPECGASDPLVPGCKRELGHEGVCRTDGPAVNCAVLCSESKLFDQFKVAIGGALKEGPAHAGAAIAARIWCPQCKQMHVDLGIWATTPHSTHLCEHCGALWRTPTVGIEGGATLLFEIDDGAARHWVSAHSAERARQLYVDSIGEEPEEWKDDPPEIAEVTRERMRTMKFTFEDGTETSMANVFDLCDHEECLVATTEI